MYPDSLPPVRLLLTRVIPANGGRPVQHKAGVISSFLESTLPQDAIAGIQWGAPLFFRQKGYFTLSPCSTFNPNHVSLFLTRAEPAPVSIRVARLLPMTIHTPLYHVYIAAEWIPKCCLSKERAQRLTMSCTKTCYYYSSD